MAQRQVSKARLGLHPGAVVTDPFPQGGVKAHSVSRQNMAGRATAGREHVGSERQLEPATQTAQCALRLKRKLFITQAKHPIPELRETPFIPGIETPPTQQRP